MYFEYKGGLGDVLMRAYRHCSYRLLAEITEPTPVVLVCHNPHARELFDLHPKRHLMEFRDLPYWDPPLDAAKRAEYNLPGETPMPAHCGDSGMDYYASDADWEHLRPLCMRPYVAIAPSAGMPCRHVEPRWVVCWIEMALKCGITPVLLGRSYGRLGRVEDFAGYEREGVVNLIDKLTVPGSFLAIRGAVGVCSAHSAAALAAWFELKPLLLVYPEDTRVGHFLREDHWSFGMARGDTFQACNDSDEGVAYATANFFAHLNRLGEEEAMGIPNYPYPLQAAAVPLAFRGSRWTPESDCRLLIHEFGKLPPGNVLELGCSVGATTYELARAFPDRTIYAVDSADARMGFQQNPDRVTPDTFCAHARNLPNVVPIYSCTKKLDLSQLQDVVGVFVDGDHTYAGVLNDSQICDRLRPRLAAYHDCYPGQEAWVGVNKVLADRRDRFRLVHRVSGSRVAFETY